MCIGINHLDLRNNALLQYTMGQVKRIVQTLHQKQIHVVYNGAQGNEISRLIR